MSLTPDDSASKKQSENQEEEEEGIVDYMKTYNKYKWLFFTRKYKFNDLVPPLDLKEAFSKFAGGGPRMSADQLRRFLAEHQGHEDCTESESGQIVEKVLKVRRGNHQTSPDAYQHVEQHGLTLEDVFYFLLLNDFNNPLKAEVHHDMDAPLSHYFIYTGHNSYLTGNQLSSDCSDEPIIKALQRGVRAIELDLWPTYNKDDIKVVHGWTLTNPVSPIKCLEAIKKNAFVASQYPVIITIEDHLTPDLQAKFAEMVTQIFGELLYYPQTECLTEFPSPESLKNRIIISTKPPKEALQSKSSKDRGNNHVLDGSESSEEESSWGQESPDSRAELETEDKNGSDKEEGDINACDSRSDQQWSPYYQSLMTIHAKKLKGSRNDKLKTDDEVRYLSWSDQTLEKASESRGTDKNGSDKEEGDINACDPRSDQQCSPDYKSLITIHARKIKGSLKDKLKIGDEVRRLSWSEQTLEKASESHGTDIVRFTQKNILRVYPRATRVQSSNFKPHLGWLYGAQMVAFNMQGHGKPLWLMQGMFRANGGCGYVKKPQILMQKPPNDDEFDPKGTLPVKKTLKVKVYMGHGWSSDFSPTHFDKCSPPDFYTRVRIVGVPVDCDKKKTRVIMDNWFPVWDEEFEFPLTVPELALLRITVKEKDQGKDDFGGQTCLPVSELRPGFRSVPLYNKKGEKYKSVKLLMRFQLIE